MSYYTSLQLKHHSVRVNIKTDMIANLTNELKERLEGPHVPTRVLDATPTILFEVDTQGTDFFSPVRKGTIPCLNVDCLWVKYLNYFHRTIQNHWRLPAFSDTGECIICHSRDSVKFSDIKITKSKKMITKVLSLDETRTIYKNQTQSLN